jgi:hypothetical protein
MRAIASAICGAEDLGRPLIIAWKKESGCGALFKDLFDPEALPPWVTVLDDEPSPLERIAQKECLSPADWDRVVASAPPGTPIRIRSHGHFYQKDSGRWQKALTSLRPRRELMGLASQPALSVGHPLIGVHIRRTDNFKAITQSPLELFINEMQCYPKDTVFFVASDDASERWRLAARFPGRIRYLAEELSRSSVNGMQEALVDFVALSRCPEILACAGSSFAEMAAAYDGAALKVLKVDVGGARCS